MSVQQSIAVNLQQAELVKFVIEHKTKQGTNVPPKFRSSFIEFEKRTVGRSPQRVYWTDVQEWGIYQGLSKPRRIASREFYCLASKPVSVEITSHLGIGGSATPTQKDEIINAFKAYDEATHGDVSDYISTQLSSSSGVDRTMFEVSLGYSVWIDGDETVDTRDIDMFKASFNASGSIIIDRTGKRTAFSEYTQDAELWPRLVSRRTLGEVQNAPAEPERTEGRDRQEIAEEKAKADQPECYPTATRTHDVADLLHWIETKIIWTEGRVDLGCGNYFTFYYPEFRSREVSYVLWASLTAPEPIDEHVERAIMNCFWQSLLGATVVGIALWNPKAALIAFKALFLACIVAKFEIAVSCVTVNLGIDTRVVVDWH